MPPLRLARVHVRDVHLDERHGDRGECITNGEAGVRVCSGIDHHAVDVVHLVRDVALRLKVGGLVAGQWRADAEKVVHVVGGAQHPDVDRSRTPPRLDDHR